VIPFALARDLPSHSRHDCEVSGERARRRTWWTSPEAPLTDEERMAELEKLAGVAA
jgi:hypothetical protein